MIEDVVKAKEFGVEKLVKSLLNVTDTINYCIQYKPNFSQPPHSENINAKLAFDALEATKKQMSTLFKNSYELEEFSPQIGDSFDPMQHNALFEVDPPAGKKIKAGKIGLVVKSGWKRKQTLLRPANVGVVRFTSEPELPPNLKM
eukprot:TRINITY_DN1331_c0_g1_i3.p1 TRINITY_DN1331_c0_g1~~TRINITY_DN1331_c0_g1_i3.p1  ORF type:complete len:145 (-),score=44.15 TRINITY_DN1331_c0_g1_i3:71-505(-)